MLSVRSITTMTLVLFSISMYARSFRYGTPSWKFSAKALKSTARGISKLTEQEAAHELENLNSKIVKFADLYHAEGSSPISDVEYDKLIKRAKSLTRKFPGVAHLCQALDRIGTEPLQIDRKVNHSQPMLSLDNAFSATDLQQFFGRIAKLATGNVEYVVEPKIDGLSLSLIYKNGVLIRAATRGNGSVGEDVTANVLQIEEIPKQVNKFNSEELEVRGEIYMSREDFSILNEKRRIDSEKKEFSTARNAAVGSLRLQNFTQQDRRLKFFAYDLRMHGTELKSQMDILNILTELGFEVAKPTFLCEEKEAYDRCLEFENSRNNLPFDTDGAVIKVNHLALRNILGENRKFPKWAIAYKFSGECARTRLQSISFQIGRTGILTPIAMLDPVNISGVTIERCTLHNLNELHRLGLNSFDPMSNKCEVLVKRSGDVIPKIISVHYDNPAALEILSVPSNCPSCNSTLVHDESSGSLTCQNTLECPAQVVEQICYFCSKSGLDIEGLGHSKVKQLYEMGIVTSIDKVFSLQKKHFRDSTKSTYLAGWGEKSIEKVLTAIDKKRIVPLSRLLKSIGIRQVGEHAANLLESQFENLEQLIIYLKTQMKELEPLVGKNASEKDLSLFFLKFRKANGHENNYPCKKLFAIKGMGTSTIVSLLIFVNDQRSFGKLQQLLISMKSTSK